MKIDWKKAQSGWNELSPREIHLWWLSIEELWGALGSLKALLNSEEKTRADRFYFEKDRDQFVLSRGGLRLILSAYLKQLPQSIQFSYHEKGKPYIEALLNEKNIAFNLSHSHGATLICLGTVEELGVDLEFLKIERQMEGLARKNFSRHELENFENCSGEEKLSCFYQLWTGKEAVLKGMGEGLSVPLQEWSLDIQKRSPSIVFKPYHGIGGQVWNVENISLPVKNYEGALAYPGEKALIQGYVGLKSSHPFDSILRSA